MPNLTPHAVGVDEDLQEGYVFFCLFFRDSRFVEKKWISKRR